MKNITIAGGITKDAVLRRTQAGEAVCGFSVAVDDRSAKEKRTLYFDCSLWGKRGEALAQYLTKGSKVTVAGDLSTREHDGKTYLTVKANDVTLHSGGQDRQGGDYDRGGAPAGGAPRGGAPRAEFDDDLPFAPEVR